MCDSKAHETIKIKRVSFVYGIGKAHDIRRCLTKLLKNSGRSKTASHGSIGMISKLLLLISKTKKHPEDRQVVDLRATR